MEETMEIEELEELAESEETDEVVAEDQETTYSVKEIAIALDITARQLRKFLRSEVVELGGVIGEDTPGKGGRYSFSPEEAAEVAKRYAAAFAPEESEDELTDEV